MAVRKVGGYVSINKILGKKETKNDVMIFVAGGKAVDRKIERINKQLTEKYEREQAALNIRQHAPSGIESLKNFFSNVLKIFHK